MKFQYVIINFLILAAVVFLFARKKVRSIFKSRYDRVNDEYREIEEAEALKEPEAKAAPTDDTAGDAAESEEIAKANAALDDRLLQIKEYEDREKNFLRAKMLDGVLKELFSVMQDSVKRLFSEEPYLSKSRALEGRIVDEILSQIKLTPGDRSYLKHHDVLYVTLTSAHPLPKELTDRVDEATKELLREVNGKTSFWVLVDEKLIGGLKLRIGDTVYDGTVEEELYNFEKSLSRDALLNGTTSAELKQRFFEKANVFTPTIGKYQRGRVMSVSDGICWMDGLADIMYGEVVEFECGERGMVLDIQHDRIGCVVFGSYENLESGSKVRRVGRIASVPVGDALLGRVVDALGSPIDGGGNIVCEDRRPIEFKAPGILDRAPVDRPLHTGIKAIDSLIPIGKGQRELIIGDRQTGKSAIAIDTIINQKGKNTVCIYVAIGQKETFIAETREKLKAHGALDYTIIVSAPASGSAALQYIAPFSGAAMGEHFMYAGRDVLIVYDDLSKHAVAYRELSLLLHRPSGREAYPGDIFYLHSRLLERAANLSPEKGGGSITALPIIETLGGDISAYIPTNVISITDGQIFLETELYNEGQRPAINVSLSVSRVGGAAQTKLLKQVSASLRTRLAQYRELAEFMQFGADVDEQTRKALKSGRLLMEALKQNRYNPVPDHLQAVLLYALTHGYADGIEPESMHEFETKLFRFIDGADERLLSKLKSGAKMDADTENALKAALDSFVSEG